MSRNGFESESEFADEDSEDELIMSDLDANFDKLGRGFPQINFPSIWSPKPASPLSSSKQEVPAGEYGHWGRKFQTLTFLNDLHKGLSFSNALTRLQTVKAITEQAISNALNSSEQGSSSGASQHFRDVPEEPTGLVPAVKPKDLPAYNDVVLPQDKDPQTLDEDLLRLTELPQDQNNDETVLRQRIQHIQSLDLEPAKKAVMMQRLMMGKFVEEPRRATPVQGGAADTEIRDPTDAEKTPTYHHSGVFGCSHYQRNCKLQCHQCLHWYTCRFCHDESPEIKASCKPHAFQRAKTKKILCMRCQHVQDPQKYCENCDEEMALYYCNECKLFDNDETKDIYHCDKCGICRLGLGLGVDFFHCDGCQASLSVY